MHNTKRKIALFRARMLVTLVALAVSLTTFAFITYSWFTTNRNVGILGPKMEVDRGLDYKLKYFVANVDGGYAKPGYEDTNTTVNSYANDFVNVTSTFHDISEFSLLKEPRFRVSFAFEITVYPYSSATNITLSLNGFTAPPSEQNYDYNNNNPIPITIEQAINVYATAFSGEGSDGELTNLANEFILLDDVDANVFARTQEENQFINYLLPPSEEKQLVVFLITVEFSNESSTYYSYHSQNLNLGQIYYVKDINGNSNVYKGLTLQFDQLIIRKLGE